MSIETMIGCRTCHAHIAMSRGVCLACYQRHKRAIRKGTTTWQQIADAGLCSPPSELADRTKTWRKFRLPATKYEKISGNESHEAVHA